jgi:hypothetical protein
MVLTPPDGTDLRDSLALRQKERRRLTAAARREEAKADAG